MYYTFNNLTGRLTGSSHMVPYYPIGVQHVEKNEPPKIIYQNKHEKFASTTSTRQAAAQKTVPGTGASYSPLNDTLKRKMEIFQKPSNVPVFLKGGAVDKGLYGLTIALCTVGLGGCIHFLYTKAFPQK